MKPCLFCAEEIQDAAILCRFCGRSQIEVQHVAPQQKSGGGSVAIGIVFGVIVALTAVGGVAAMMNQGKTAGGAGADSTATSAFAGMADSVFAASQELIPPPEPPPPPPPSILSVVNESAVNIRADHYAWYPFVLDDPRTCTLTGRILGLAGGNRDFDVLVVDEDGFSNWKNNSRGRTYFHMYRTSAVTLNLQLYSPGTYYLVVSNVFSVVTDKAVQMNDVKVTCE